MAIEAFPVHFPLDEYVSAGRIAFFLDALNEVPGPALEENSFRRDLRDFISKVGDCKVVLVTRFPGENSDLELPELELDAISDDYLKEHLPETGIRPDNVSVEIRALLRRPFYFRFFLDHALPADIRKPHTVYESVLRHLEAEYQHDLDLEVNLVSIFGSLAFSRLDAGEQLMPIDEVIDTLASSLPESDPSKLLNRLIENGIVVAGADRRVAFFHHSVTEYLAGRELAQRYQHDEVILAHCLRQRHWDHALLLALDFLSPEDRSKFFGEVFSADAAVGFRALAFLETDRGRWTHDALQYLGQMELSFNAQMRIGNALGSVDFEPDHIEALTEVAKRGDTLGGTAMAAIVALRGEDGISSSIDDLIEHAADYNYVSTVAITLAKFVDVNDLRYLLQRVDEHPVTAKQRADLEAGEEVRSLVGLLASATTLLETAALDQVRELIGPLDEASILTQEVLLDRVRDDASTLGLKTSTELLPINRHAAIVSLSFQLRFADPDPDAVASLEPGVVGPSLIEALDSSSSGWATDCLRSFAMCSSRWADWISEMAAAARGVKRALLHYGALEEAEYFATLRDLANGNTGWQEPATEGISQCSDVSWRGNESLFMDLLQQEDPDLSLALLDSIYGGGSEYELFRDPGLGAPRRWVEWMARIVEEGGSYFLCDRLGRFIAEAATSVDRTELLELLSEGDPNLRDALAHHILPRIPNLRIQELDEKSLSWLIADLSNTEQSPFENSVLASVATEEFMDDVIIPLFQGAGDDETLRKNIAALAETAGRRHGRRYLTTNGREVVG